MGQGRDPEYGVERLQGFQIEKGGHERDTFLQSRQ